MGPYRSPTQNHQGIADNAPLNDSVGLGVILSLIGGARVIAAITTHELWGGEVMIAVVLLCLGLREVLFRAAA